MKKLFLFIAAALVSTGMWAGATFTMSSIFDGSNLSKTVTTPAAATISTTTNASNAKDGKLGSDGNYFQIILTNNTFTAASINGYINTTKTDKNWAFQFSTNGGTSWSDEVTQANDGDKTAHDIDVDVSIPANANGIRVIRRAGTSTIVYSITLTLTYSITYEENGHGENQTDLTRQTKLPNSLPVLSETGWEFGGWFADDGTFNTQITAGGALTKDTTLYAKWTLATYSVTLHTNGGTINSGNVTSYTYSIGATLPTDVTQSGKDFLGWYATSDCLGDRVYTIANDATGNKEYWANWQEEAAKHSITYANYGDADISAYPTQYAEGVGVEFFADLADTEDEHFTGWSPASIATTATTDQVITATWEAKKVVTFDSNGGTAVEAQKVVKGETVSEPADPTRLNYNFEGWKLGNDDYDFSAAVNNDIELVAQWSRKTISGDDALENYIADTEHSKEVASASSYTAISFSLKKLDSGAWDIAKDYSSASSDDSKTFEYAFLPNNGSTNETGYELTASKNISSLVVYYTMTDSKFTTADQSKSGTFTYQINSEDAVVSSVTVNKSNKTAYKETISDISKDDVVKLYASANRLAIFAIYATYESDPLYVKFTVNDVTTDSITTTTGEKLGNLFIDGELPTPEVSGYTFKGWKNAANNAAVDKNTAVGEVSMVVYADLEAEGGETALDNANDEAKAVKRLVNGQLFIEKNGHVYNVLGGCVK